MKTLNFTVVEVLPSLLDRSKCQTIRPAWEQIKLGSIVVEENPTTSSGAKVFNYQEKPAKFKVGEQVKLMWNAKSKYEWFCKCDPLHERFDGLSDRCLQTHRNKTFHKNLGTAEITEVFKISLKKKEIRIPWEKRHPSHISEYDAIAKLDGFKSAAEMSKWINNEYDISVVKPFWVYRYKWLPTMTG